MRRADPETKASAIGHTGGQREQDAPLHRRGPGPGARAARFGPRFTASAALHAGPDQRDFQRHHRAAGGIATRQRDFRPEGVGLDRVAEKHVALALDERGDGWKIDRRLVSKALVTRRIGADRVPDDRQRLRMKVIAAHTETLSNDRSRSAACQPCHGLERMLT